MSPGAVVPARVEVGVPLERRRTSPQGGRRGVCVVRTRVVLERGHAARPRRPGRRPSPNESDWKVRRPHTRLIDGARRPRGPRWRWRDGPRRTDPTAATWQQVPHTLKVVAMVRPGTVGVVTLSWRLSAPMPAAIGRTSYIETTRDDRRRSVVRGDRATADASPDP